MDNLPFDEYRHMLARVRLGEYLHSKRSSNGGYCSYRNAFVEGSNLADSYYALRSFILIGEGIPEAGKVIDFLHEFSPMQYLGQLFYYVGCWKCLDPDYSVPPAWASAILRLNFPSLPRKNRSVTAWLDQALAIVKLKNEICASFDKSRLLADLQTVFQRNGHGRSANTVDTWLAFQILHACDKPFPVQSHDMATHCQRLPSGFSIWRQANSPRLDAVHAGVGLCLLTKTPIRYRSEILSFVLACQCNSGAFALAPASAPDIELSYKAIWILHALANVGTVDTPPQQDRQPGLSDR